MSPIIRMVSFMLGLVSNWKGIPTHLGMDCLELPHERAKNFQSVSYGCIPRLTLDSHIFSCYDSVHLCDHIWVDQNAMFAFGYFLPYQGLQSTFTWYFVEVVTISIFWNTTLIMLTCPIHESQPFSALVVDRGVITWLNWTWARRSLITILSPPPGHHHHDHWSPRSNGSKGRADNCLCLVIFLHNITLC